MSGLSLNAYSYNGLISGGTTKLHVPVQPASVLYAQFDHVSGFAARTNQNGVSISKIHILNSLLNQAISMRTAPKTEPLPEVENMDDNQIDALIQNYQQQIQNSVQMAQTTGYGLAGAAPQTGTMFALDV